MPKFNHWALLTNVFVTITLLLLFTYWLSSVEITYLKTSGIKTVKETNVVPENPVGYMTFESVYGMGDFSSGNQFIVFHGNKTGDVMDVTVNVTKVIEFIRTIRNCSFFVIHIETRLDVEGGIIQWRSQLASGHSSVKLLGKPHDRMRFDSIQLSDISFDLYFGQTLELPFNIAFLCIRETTDPTYVFFSYQIHCEVWEEKPQKQEYEVQKLTFTTVHKHLIGDYGIPYSDFTGDIYYSNGPFRAWVGVAFLIMVVLLLLIMVMSWITRRENLEDKK